MGIKRALSDLAGTSTDMLLICKCDCFWVYLNEYQIEYGTAGNMLRGIFRSSSLRPSREKGTKGRVRFYDMHDVASLLNMMYEPMHLGKHASAKPVPGTGRLIHRYLRLQSFITCCCVSRYLLGKPLVARSPPNHNTGSLVYCPIHSTVHKFVSAEGYLSGSC